VQAGRRCILFIDMDNNLLYMQEPLLKYKIYKHIKLYGEVVNMSVKVGQKAPDFEANAFVDGGFKKVKLSDYKDKWVVICFYPGDFTFV